MPLKWALISFRISNSLSFSASRSMRVRSTYSRKRAPRARESLSNAPLVLESEMCCLMLDLCSLTETLIWEIAELQCVYVQPTCHWWLLSQPAAQKYGAAAASVDLSFPDASYSSEGREYLIWTCSITTARVQKNIILKHEISIKPTSGRRSKASFMSGWSSSTSSLNIHSSSNKIHKAKKYISMHIIINFMNAYLVFSFSII